jgi:hypothetical protein
MADLDKRTTRKPGTVKALRAAVSNLFQKNVSQPQLDALVEALQARGVVTVSSSKVSYGDATRSETQISKTSA